MMKKLLLNLLFVATLSQLAHAQILPPDFLCVKGDSLFWDLPSNPCGPFNAYEIWGSQSPGGPFILLATVTDPSQASFFHSNPSGETWFYYLLSDFDCPGQAQIPSDTLDNELPEVSPLRSVSVEGNTVVLNWQPSPSPEVTGYIIYRQTGIGVVPVDTVFGATTYTDLDANPQNGSETYLVNALDPCGNTSIFDLKHKTVFLETTVSPCEQIARLTWNLYENWQNGIGEQEVWVGVNGAAPVLFQNAGASAAAFDVGPLNDGDGYCFQIRAVEQGTGEVSKSNEICLTADIVQAMRNLHIRNVTVTAAGSVDVSWGWETTAEIKTFDILRSPQNTDYQSIVSNPAPAVLPPLNTFNDPDATPATGQIFYKIQTTDDCDSIVLSTYGSTIFLHAAAKPNGINLLAWTTLDIENAVPTGYEIFRVLNGTETNLGVIPSPTANFEDPFDPALTGGLAACYYVVGEASLTLPDGSQTTIRSRSNLACAEQKLRVFVPNAFAPEGFNQVFKPLIVPPEIAKYELHIFDRYGQELFVSTAADVGWNGKKGGKEMPQGVYIFFIRATTSEGEVVERRGSVLLLR